MNLAEEIRTKRLNDAPFDASEIEKAVREWFDSHNGNKVWFDIRHFDPKKGLVRIGYKGSTMSIPLHWERPLWNWALTNGFTPSTCRGAVTLEL